MDSLKELAAALNGHEITDEDGQITELEESAPQDEMEDSTEAEKPAESEVEETQTETNEDETEPVEDEEGKRYVPEKRFKDVYGKFKSAERELERLRTQPTLNVPAIPRMPIDKAEALETELLFTQFPQFSPTNPDYNEDLDKVAANIYQSSNGTITKVEAARQAVTIAKNLQAKNTSIKEGTRVIKRQVSESVSAKGGQTVAPEINPDNMSADELETYLKANKMW